MRICRTRRAGLLVRTGPPWIRGLAQRPWPVILAALLLSVGAFFYASRLTVESDLSKLIPEEYESVQALRTLQETLGGESEATIAVESPSFAANRRFAEALIPAALAMQGSGYEEPYFTRIAYRRDVSFLEQNALYFATGAELDSLLAYLRRELEQARLVRDGRGGASAPGDGVFFLQAVSIPNGGEVESSRRGWSS